MKRTLFNQFGITFKECQYAIDKRSDMIHSYFICTICNQIYITKKSMEKHRCVSIMGNDISYDKALKYLLIWISKKNVSFRALGDIDFKGFLWTINKKYILPSEKTIRKEIYRFSNIILSKIYQKLDSKKVSLLIDGVKRNNRRYQGQIIYTPEQLYFIGLTPCVSETKLEISEIISNTAIKLSNNNCDLIAVCTDNFSSNIAALKGGRLSAQNLSNQNFIRFPCTCHTINLAIKDIFEGKYKYIYDSVILMINYFNQISKYDNQICNVPQFHEVRWFSIYYCVCYIISHKQYLNEYFLSVFNYIQIQYNWLIIHSILHLLESLILKLEGDYSSIGDVFYNFKTTLNELIKINDTIPEDTEPNITKDIINTLLFRFSKTVTLEMPILAFFMTGKGLVYANIKDDQYYLTAGTGIDALKNYAKNSSKLEKLVQFFKILLKYNNDTFLIDQDTTEDSVTFWKSVLEGGPLWRKVPEFLKNNAEYTGFEKKYAKFALKVLSIPCSESAVERVFSHLSDLLMSNKRNLSFHSINSILIIRMNSIFLNQKGKNSYDFIKNDLEKLCNVDFEKHDPQFEDDPLVYF